MSYQSFNNETGSSKSTEKFNALRLPPLANKRVLDIGCNEGFFSFKAIELGASEVKGIDIDINFIRKANDRKIYFEHPNAQNCNFMTQGWDEIGNNKYDVILFLSAIHYSSDQEKTLLKLIDQNLSEDGVLILELGIVPETSLDEFILIKRAIDSRYFPSMVKVKSMLKNYAYKIIGRSVDQAGDPTPRWVIHIKKMKSTAILIEGDSATGKSTLLRKFQDKNIGSLSIDDLLMEIKNDFYNSKAPGKLDEFINKHYDGLKLDLIYYQIMANNCHLNLISRITERALNLKNATESEIIAVEGFPLTLPRFRSALEKSLNENGFFIWNLNKTS